MPNKKPLAAIVRSSDRVAERQREGTYHGDEEQRAEVDRYCKARGLSFELLPPELDMSGGKPIEERPSLRAAIEGVEAGTYSGIVTANLKRLTRSRSGLAIWDRVEAAGGHVHTAAEAIDTSSPNGRFMRDVFLADAVREREEHAERHAKRRAATVEAGMWRQRQLPRGYAFAGPPIGGKYTGKARRLVPGPDAESVRKAARDVIAGAPVLKVARELGMTPSGIRAMLRNRVYLGELRDGPNFNLRAHESILDTDTFNAVGHALRTNTRPARSPRHNGPALLAGLVVCAGCGHRMTRGGSVSISQYSCPTNHSGHRCPAPASVTAAKLDGYVDAIALTELSRLAVSTSASDESESRRAALVAAQNELDSYLEAVSATDVGVEAFGRGARLRREAVDKAETELRAELERRPAVLPWETGSDVWPTLTVSQRNQVLRGLLACIVVERSGGRGIVRPLPARVRVLAHGAPVRLAGKGSGKGVGIHPISLADLDVDYVLGMSVSQNAPEHLRS